MYLYSGGGKRPETWTTVVECLRVVDLNYLADSVENLFEDEPSVPQPITTGKCTTLGVYMRCGGGGCTATI